MTQNNYTPLAGKLGARATSDPITSVSRKYVGRPQISTLTFAGTPTDGTYSNVFEDLDVDNITVEVERVAGSPATDTDLAAQYVVNANTDSDLRRFFIFTSALGVVTITARENGNPFTLASVTAPAPGTLVAATTQTSAPVNLPMGIAVVNGTGQREIVQPTGASTAFDIVGITWDGQASVDSTLIPTLGVQGSFESPFASGSMVPTAKGGVYYVHPEVDIVQGDPVFVRVVATGVEVFGQLRNDADGGDAVQIQGVWEWNGSANQPTAVRLNLPGGA